MKRQNRMRLFIGALTLLCLRSGIGHAAGVVTTCDEASLRAALAGGGTVTFSCDGTIVLAHTIVIAKSTVLDATGHSITLDGNQKLPVLQVKAGLRCALTNLVIADGNSFTDGSSPTNFLPGGGGVFNDGGIMQLTRCTFKNNVAEPFIETDAAVGGGLLNQRGHVTLNECIFSGNMAKGMGGGLYNDGGSAALSNCTFSDNTATGFGGGLANRADQCTLLNCAFYRNTVNGFKGNEGEGPGAGDGRAGQGGALYNADGSINSINCTFAANQAIGGDGGDGDPDGFITTDGGNGGTGLGGAIYNASGAQVLTNCTLAGNQALGGGAGQGVPLSHIRGKDGVPGVGHGGGIAAAIGNVVLHNTLLGLNSNGNSYGTIVDRGHNLSSDTTPAFGPNSYNNAFAGLGPLADNGGPTQTLGLYAHSQAIDTADNSACPATDQRGVARPQGSGCDIGAFEGTVADTVAPTVQITLPVDKTPRSNLNAIRGTANDDSGPGGVARVDVFIQRNSDKKYWTGNVWGAKTPLSTTLTNNTTRWARLADNPRGPNLKDGLYTIQARAYDQAGNQSTLTAITTQVDQTPPTISVTSPAPGAHLSLLPALRGPVRDNAGGSDIDHVEVLIQRGSDLKFWTGQTWSVPATRLKANYSPHSWSYADELAGGGDFADLGSGLYLIIARAYDKAGNVTRAQSLVTVTQVIPPATSLIQLSSTQLVYSNDDYRLDLELTFTGPLDPATVNDPTVFQVLGDDYRTEAINSVYYDSQRHTVILTIDYDPSATYVIASWHGLRDAQGKKVRDQDARFQLPYIGF